MYFNYHAKLKNLIQTGHAVGFERFVEYHGISPCILIYFDNGDKWPVREYRFDEYLFLFAKFGVEQIYKDE